ncbi:MAG: hypothetical protein NVSMB62_14350 [Acidobacteriaceae bacterium]
MGTGVGTHVFVAAYTGDATHAPSASLPVTLTVAPDRITAYTLVPSANPSPLGQPVTFTATLTGEYAPPTGTYSVLDGETAIGTLTLVPVSGTYTSTGTITATLPGAGTHTIGAPYPGDANFRADVGPAVHEVINAPLTTVSRLASSGNPSVTGQAVTFTDTVTPTGGGLSGIAMGRVTFLDGAFVLGSSVLNGAGVAAFTTSALAVGSHTITAVSAGDAGTAGRSASVTQVVTWRPPAGSESFSVTVTPNPVGVRVGNSAEVGVRVAAVGGGTPAAVTLSCGGLPAEASCTFSHAVIPAGGGTTTLLVSTAAPHGCGSTEPFIAGRGAGPGERAPLVLPGLAAVFSFAVPGRRRWMRSLMALAAVAGALQMSGCGTCIVSAMRPGTYTMRVTGVSAEGLETEGTSVVVNVHQ